MRMTDKASKCLNLGAFIIEVVVTVVTVVIVVIVVVVVAVVAVEVVVMALAAEDIDIVEDISAYIAKQESVSKKFNEIKCFFTLTLGQFVNVDQAQIVNIDNIIKIVVVTLDIVGSSQSHSSKGRDCNSEESRAKHF